jgi:putative membrane protein insertion efficiency factor
VTGRPDRGRPWGPARIGARAVRGWRVFSTRMTPRCRFPPSCSAYAHEALERHGAARGAGLAVKRVGRCHPWNPGGIDPVPEPTTSSNGDTNVRSPLKRPEAA